MKRTNIIAIGTLATMSLISTAFIARQNDAQTPHASIKHNGFAVLELFTSEGCSSCPPAEKLLARIQEKAGNSPIYVLAYHVDYWDRLGWKDSFSDAKFSDRQNQYNHQFTRQIYTPQLIVNGKSEYVGSDEGPISNAVNRALSDSTETALQIQGQLQEGKLNVDYEVAGNTGKSQLLIAVVQRHATSHVRAGENEGRTLPHVQIVRNLYTWNLEKDATGKQSINLPNGFNKTDWEIIGLIQDRQTGAIDAATKVEIKG